MAAQGERVSRANVICRLLDPMAQDKTPVQDISIPEQDIVMGELELPPQMDPEPEMGAAAAAVCDAPPPHLRQSPSHGKDSEAQLLGDCGATTHIVNDSKKFVNFDPKFQC